MTASEELRLALDNLQGPEFAATRALVDAGWKWRLLLIAHEAELKCFRESSEGAAIMASIEHHARRSGGGK